MIHLTKLEAARLGLVPPAKPVRRGPNKLEARYMAHLEVRKCAGQIRDYGYEAIKLKIGVRRCFFTPDFWVWAIDGVTELHETKGWLREDARVKLQSAARQYPMFRFFLVRADLGGWNVEPVE